MATLEVTIPDTVVPRIRLAVGRANTPVGEPIVPATVTQVEDACKRFLKGLVTAQAGESASKDAQDAVAEESW